MGNTDTLEEKSFGGKSGIGNISPVVFVKGVEGVESAEFGVNAGVFAAPEHSGGHVEDIGCFLFFKGCFFDT